MVNFVAHDSRFRLALLFLTSVVFVVGGFWAGGAFGAAPSSPRYPDAVIFSVGWFSVVFFGLGGVVALKRFLNPREQLEIGSYGVRWFPWSAHVIPWSDITDVTTWRHKQQKAIVLHLRNPPRFQGRRLAAAFAGANRTLTGGDIFISLTGTDRTFEEAVSAIARFRS
ncbi:MAG: STM3941 family protein [Sphingomicrobium sp.]